MTKNIRGLADHLPALSALQNNAYVHLGGAPRPPHLAALPDQFWPECYTSEMSGKTIMAPADSARLETLFKLFGEPMAVADNSLEVLGHASDVFAVGLSAHVGNKLHFPGKVGARETLRETSQRWPQDWVSFIGEVAVEDFTESRRLAVKLQVPSPDCAYPLDTFIESKKGLEARLGS